jgi:hypothetical protein
MRDMRKQEKKEKYYHIGPEGKLSAEGVVVKIRGSKLESVTQGISIEKLIGYCGLYLNEEGLKSTKNYLIKPISENRAYKIVGGFKTGFSSQHWI